MTRRAAVTGAAGFLGRAIVARLAERGWQVRAITRDGAPVHGAVEAAASGDLLLADPRLLLAECDAVVHCAARVHILRREDPAQAETEYRRMNADLPVTLAQAAKAAGARHFVQLSSAAAIASSSASGEMITDASPPRPSSPYGRSKLAADEALAELADERFAVVSLRPPAIFGPGVGAWFALYNRAARAGLPLPLSRIVNTRSFAFSANVADAVAQTLDARRSGAWLVTDSDPLSVAALYRKLLALHGHGDRVWAVPRPLVVPALRLALRGRASSLLGSAWFDGSRFAREFGWAPPTSLDDGLERTIRAAG